MPLQWRRVWGILAVAFLLTPFAVVAQEGRRGDRGDIQVANDWEQTRVSHLLHEAFLGMRSVLFWPES
jgi:hypothetical protein